MTTFQHLGAQPPSDKRGFRRCLPAAVLLASVGIASADPGQALLVDGPTYTQPQTLVEVEPGRRLNLHCTGSGTPVVVLEAGLTDPINVWGLVQPRLGAETRVCAYDRAGIGYSDEATRPSTSAHMVDDLHRLLSAAGIATPIVLVGHSAGGMHARLFAYTYPALVAGMVLVDPSHEDQTEGYRQLDLEKRSPAEWEAQVLQPSLVRRKACIVAAEAGIEPGSTAHKDCKFAQYPQLSQSVQQATEAFQLTAKFQRAQLSEEDAIFHASADQLRGARRSLGALPVIVLNKDRSPPPKEPLTDEKAAAREARYALWLRLGRQSAAISTEGVQRIVPGAGHGMPLETPDAVVAAIREVVATVRGKADGGN
jgi:pimeloyl-ACP methyl ester carboxylesterase